MHVCLLKSKGVRAGVCVSVYVCVCVCVCVCRYFDKICRWNFLTRCLGKFGIFYHKKWNAEFYQYPVPQKSNFYWRWRLLKKLYKICTDDYDNNEYLAVKYIRFFTNDIIFYQRNVMFINKQKRQENKAVIPT